MDSAECSISSYSQDCFVIVFDGPTSPKAHSVAIFANFHSKTFLFHSSASLAIFALENETKQNTDEHIRYQNLLSSCLDNFKVMSLRWLETTLVLAGLLEKIIFITCSSASHHFHLAVKKIMAGEIRIASEVQKLIEQLGALLPSARLRQKTHLEPKLKDDTRCSSTYQTMFRQVQLRKHLLNPYELKSDPMLLIPAAEHGVDVLMEKLKSFNEVTKTLYWSDESICSARTYSNTVVA